jgi:sortase A
MNKRFRLSSGDASILVGAALLLFSIGGLYVGSASGDSGYAREASPGRVIYEVAHPTLPPAPTRDAPPAQVVEPPTAQPQDAPAADSSFLVPGTPPPTPDPQPQALVPQRLVIPVIALDAPVLPTGYSLIEIDGQVYQQWEAPSEYAAGWQQTSAYLGVPGNTVLNGHHNIFGSVFGRLNELIEGDLIEVHSGDSVITYTITSKLLLSERGEPLSVRLENGRWMQSTTDERLTLVTCWPPDSNTHRLLIVAQPVEKHLASSGP